MKSNNIAEKRFVPTGLDFVPVGGGPADLVFGVVRRKIKEGPERNVPDAVLRRLCPGQTPVCAGDWTPSCYRSDVLLPLSAANELQSAQALCEYYEANAFEGLKDLLVMITLRFPHADRLHVIWEEVRAFAYECFCRRRSLAVVAAMHLPGAKGSTNPPHIHLMIPARELRAWGFSDFIRPLASDHGKGLILGELSEWVADFGPASALAGIVEGHPCSSTRLV